MARGFTDPDQLMQDLLDYVLKMGEVSYDGILKLVRDLKFALKSGKPLSRKMR